MNQGGTLTLPALPDADALLKVIADLRDHFKDLLTGNERSWRARPATTH